MREGGDTTGEEERKERWRGERGREVKDNASGGDKAGEEEERGEKKAERKEGERR